MAARSREAEGVDAYEGLLRERLYLGLSAARFRRERSLFESERVARIRWDRREGRTIQWLGARDDAPMIGDRGRVVWDRGSDDQEGGSISLSLGRGGSEAEQRQVQDALLNNLNPPIFSYRPGDDRLAFGNRFALHPLADSAVAHYRYRTGDTLRVTLPGNARDLMLVEVQVEPRRAAFELLAGPLWFDSETGDLVRAHYRPSQPFDMAMDEGEDVPGIFSPFRVDIEYLTVEYSLHESRWWLPHRFGARGEVRAGKLLRAPMAVEWSVGDYLVNTTATMIPRDEALTSGWASSQNDSVRILAPPGDSLRNSPHLTGEMLGPSAIAFSAEEIEALTGDLKALMPAQEPFRSGFAWGLADHNVRYNRVEGLSLGASTELGVGRDTWLEPRARFGLLDQQLRGSLGVHRGDEGARFGVAAYRRLSHTDDFGDPLGLGASLSNLVLRNGHTQFFNTSGIELNFERRDRRVRTQGRAFWERHASVKRETNFYLWEPLTGDTLPSVIAAEEGAIFGVAGDLRWQLGDAPHRGVASGLLRAEVAGGDFRYQRILGTLSAGRSLGLGLAGAFELGGGVGWGALPTQKQFYLGGAHTLRGYSGSYTQGGSFWLARGELATALPLARVAVFSDLGWAGPREDWTRSKPLWSAGAGLSFLDGVVRVDAAWPIRAASGGRLYFYLDGLF